MVKIFCLNILLGVLNKLIYFSTTNYKYEIHYRRLIYITILDASDWETL